MIAQPAPERISTCKSTISIDNSNEIPFTTQCFKKRHSLSNINASHYQSTSSIPSIKSKPEEGLAEINTRGRKLTTLTSGIIKVLFINAINYSFYTAKIIYDK